MITIEAIGLEGAAAQIDYLQNAIKAYSGCYYRGSSRQDAGGTNAKVLGYLADNDPPRDLKTLSDENAEVIGDAWKGEVEKQLNMMAENAAAGGKAAKLSTGGVARAASGAGMRAAGKVVLRMLRERIVQNLSADDSGNLSPAAPVSEAYAAQRERKYGVARNEVYKATGALLADMDPANTGQIVLVPGAGVK